MPIRRDALLLLRGVAGVERAVEVPHLSATGPALAAAAKRMTEALRPYASFLKKQGVKATFLADLRQAVVELKRWEASVPKKVAGQKAATAALSRLFSESTDIVRSLEGMVMARATREPAVWKEWVHTRKEPPRTGRPPKSRTVSNRPG